MTRFRPTRTMSLATALAAELGADLGAVERIVRSDRPMPGFAPDRTTLLPALVAGLERDEDEVARAFDRVEAAREAAGRARWARLSPSLGMRPTPRMS